MIHEIRGRLVDELGRLVFGVRAQNTGASLSPAQQRALDELVRATVNAYEALGPTHAERERIRHRILNTDVRSLDVRIELGLPQ